MKLLLCSIINPGLAAENYCFKSFLSSKAVAQETPSSKFLETQFHFMLKFNLLLEKGGKCLGIYEL